MSSPVNNNEKEIIQQQIKLYNSVSAIASHGMASDPFLVVGKKSCKLGLEAAC